MSQELKGFPWHSTSNYWFNQYFNFVDIYLQTKILKINNNEKFTSITSSFHHLKCVFLRNWEIKMRNMLFVWFMRSLSLCEMMRWRRYVSPLYLQYWWRYVKICMENSLMASTYACIYYVLYFSWIPMIHFSSYPVIKATLKYNLIPKVCVCAFLWSPKTVRNYFHHHEKLLHEMMFFVCSTRFSYVMCLVSIIFHATCFVL